MDLQRRARAAALGAGPCAHVPRAGIRKLVSSLGARCLVRARLREASKHLSPHLSGCCA